MFTTKLLVDDYPCFDYLMNLTIPGQRPEKLFPEK